MWWLECLLYAVRIFFQQCSTSHIHSCLQMFIEFLHSATNISRYVPVVIPFSCLKLFTDVVDTLLSHLSRQCLCWFLSFLIWSSFSFWVSCMLYWLDWNSSSHLGNSIFLNFNCSFYFFLSSNVLFHFMSSSVFERLMVSYGNQKNYVIHLSSQQQVHV